MTCDEVKAMKGTNKIHTMAVVHAFIAHVAGCPSCLDMIREHEKEWDAAASPEAAAAIVRVARGIAGRMLDDPELGNPCK